MSNEKPNLELVRPVTNVSVDEFLDAAFAFATDDEHEYIGSAYFEFAENTNIERIGEGVYTSVAMYDGTEKQDPEKNNGIPYLSREHENVTRVHFIMLDDLGTKADEEVNMLDPSYKLESSPDNFQYGYFLKEPISAEQAENLMVRFRATGYKYGDKGAYSIGRLARVPAGRNGKTGSKGSFKPHITRDNWHPELRYSVEDIIEAFELPEVTPRKQVKKNSDAADFIDNSGSDYPRYIDEVLVTLHKHGYLISNRASGGFFTIKCPWHEEHTTGSDTAGYSPIGYGGDAYKDSRGFKCQHGHCAHRTYRDLAEHLSTEDYYNPVPMNQPIAEFLNRYVHVGDSGQVYDLDGVELQGREMPLPNFKSMYNDEIESRFLDWKVKQTDDGVEHTPVITRLQGSLGSQWHRSTNRLRVVSSVFKPEGARIVSSEDGKQYLNVYREPNFPKPSKVEMPSVFKRHMDYLIPDDDERRYFMDWLAFKIQNPARRAYGVIMVTEAHGTGRTTLTQIISKLVMGQSVLVEYNKLVGDVTFNEFLANVLFIFVNETKQSKVSDLSRESQDYEKLKQWVDDVVQCCVEINNKYGKKTYVDLYAVFLLLSNHYNALQIPEDDRRFLAISNADRRMEDEGHYAELHAFKDDMAGIAQLYWALMEWELSEDFSPNRPPMTDAKRRMRALSVTRLDALKALIKQNLKSPLVTREQLIALGTRISLAVDATADVKRAKDIASKLFDELPALYPKEPKKYFEYQHKTDGKQRRRVAIVNDFGSPEARAEIDKYLFNRGIVGGDLGNLGILFRELDQMYGQKRAMYNAIEMNNSVGSLDLDI